MVEINSRDTTMLVSLSIAIILISMVLPGIAGSTNISEPPQFDVDSSRFDFAGAFPSQPKEIASESIEFNYSSSTTGEARYGSTLRSGEFYDVTSNTNTSYTFEWVYINDTGGEYVAGSTDISEGETKSFEIWANEEDDIGQNIFPTQTVDLSLSINETSSIATFDITLYRAGDTGFVQSIAYVGDVLLYGFGWVIEIFANTFGIIFDAITYVIDLVAWFITAYGEILSLVPSWAALVLSIPYMIVGLVLLKAVLVVIEVLWVG